MYNAEARARRQCKALRKNGERCQAWALWVSGDAQLCSRHAGPDVKRAAVARFVVCRCKAYQWPHRPGGGLCRWPLAPLVRFTIPAGTHSFPRLDVYRLYRKLQ